MSLAALHRWWLRARSKPPIRRNAWRPRLEELESRLTPSQIGANDFRISNMGPDSNANFGGFAPAIAYNSSLNQYLVVWSGDEIVNNDLEIYGQVLDAATGAPLGPDFRISNMGAEGDATRAAVAPDVAYNSAANEYLVVWTGNLPATGEDEVFGQRLSATGEEIGVNDFRISNMGVDGDFNFEANRPALAYDSTSNQYLVVWDGNDDASPDDFEIFGQLLDASGAEIDADFRISSQGPEQDNGFLAEKAAVVFNSADSVYLVVWEGDLKEGEREIFGQLLKAKGTEASVEFRISEMGPADDNRFAAREAALAYNPVDNEFLVVWSADDSTDNEIEIFGQRLTGADGAEVGAANFRISDMGPDTVANFDAGNPAVSFNSVAREYMVVWDGDDGTAPLVDEEREIFGQRLNANPAAFGEVGVNDFRISDAGPDGDANFDAFLPALAFNSVNNQFLAVWQSDDDALPLVNNEFEIFGQRLAYEVRVVLRNVKVAGKNTLFVAVLVEGTNTEIRRFKSPFQKPTYSRIKVTTQDTNADGFPDQIVLSAVKAAKTVTRTRALQSSPPPSPIETDDFRISNMGLDGDTALSAFDSAAAYNSDLNQYLVVWSADEIVNQDFEIYGQVLDGARGAPLGADFRISNMGPEGDNSRNAVRPQVAYNSAAKEYLVVWTGNGLANDDETEIFGQRLSATGEEIGVNDFRISTMGTDGNTSFFADVADLAYNSILNQYLVVWAGRDDSAPQDIEIYGQVLDAAGAPVGGDFRISHQGPDDDPELSAFLPVVVHNSTNNLYLVVWQGQVFTTGFDEKNEVFGQLLTAAGAEPSPEFPISAQGPADDEDFDARSPALAYNSVDNEYLVVWEGDDDVDDEFEIFGQRLAGATAAKIGAAGFRISDMGDDTTAFRAEDPAVSFSSVAREYLVVWSGDDDTAPLANNEREIFGQRLNAKAAAFGEVGVNDFRVSQMGPDGNTGFGALFPALAYNSVNNQFLVVWEGDDDTPPLVRFESEIFGQLILFKVRAVLKNVKVAGKNTLFVVILFEDTNNEKRRFKSPFQKPAFSKIKVTAQDTDGDGFPDKIVLTGVKAGKTVTKTFNP